MITQAGLLQRFPDLDPSVLTAAKSLLIETFGQGGKLLIAGNGGSSADGEHIAGELMKGFLLRRTPEESLLRAVCDAGLPREKAEKLQKGLPCLPLAAFSSLCTAVSNDRDPALIFAQAVLALGRKGDCLLALSTSGNSENVVAAAQVARALGLRVLSLTGKTGGRLKALSDCCLCVGETETYRVQEMHLPVYHWLCAEIEQHFYGQESASPFSESTQKRETPPVGVSTCLCKKPGEEFFRQCREAGVTHLELSFSTYEESMTIDFARYRDWADRYGLTLWSMHLPFLPFSTLNPASDDETVRRFTVGFFEQLMKEAHEQAGISRFVLHPSGEPIHERDREMMMKQAVISLRELCDIARGLGCVIAVENLPRTCLGRDADDMAELLAADPDLRFCLDNNHLAGQPYGEFLLRFAHRLETVHLSDYYGKDECHLLPGEGTVDFSGLLSELVRIGYTGPFLYEVSPGKPENGQFAAISPLGTRLLTRKARLTPKDIRGAFNRFFAG